LTEELAARPLQAALASAGTFACGAAVPLLTVIVAPPSVILVSLVSLLCLVALGAFAARAGGAPAWAGAVRVGFWGALAMAATAGVGRLFGAAIG
jgi:VIT1/CCC1 family predicted Fe2+/Mn2+ transporter